MRVLSNAELTQRLEKLEQSFFTSRNREVDNTYRSEDALNKADALTPYTETKTAYIGDTEVEFEPPTDGNVSVFFDKNVGNYRLVKNYYARRMMVIFDNPLEEATKVTISIS